MCWERLSGKQLNQQFGVAGLIRARIDRYLLIGIFVAATGYAQVSPGASGSPASKSAAAGVGKRAVPASERVVLRVGNAEVTEADFESRIGDIEGQADPDREGS